MTTSVATPLMDRTVCGQCGHMHRPRLRFKCACCADDVRDVLGWVPATNPDPGAGFGEGEEAA